MSYLVFPLTSLVQISDFLFPFMNFIHTFCRLVNKQTILYWLPTDTGVLVENTPLVNFVRNHIRNSSGVFSISSQVEISMISHEIKRVVS